MIIKWTADNKSEYPSYTGTDDDGNIYHMPAHMETVSVTTPDGRIGRDWTAEGALLRAEKV